MQTLKDRWLDMLLMGAAIVAVLWIVARASIQ